MIKKLFLYLFIVLVSTGCKNNSVRISGTIVDPVSGAYIILDELKSNELKPIDSIMVSTDGKFNFKREIKQPSFYLLKSNNNNFLTLLVKPGEKISMKVNSDSLNYPIDRKSTRLNSSHANISYAV